MAIYSKLLVHLLAIAGLAVSPAGCGYTAVDAGVGFPPVTHVYVVFKSHYDIGYNRTVAEALTRYRTTDVDVALATAEQTGNGPKEEQFAWTVPGWPLTRMLDGEQTPERRARLAAAIRDGRMIVHALPFNSEDEALGYEDLVRGMGFASKICREFGKPLPIAAKMTDVPEHSWVLPTLLKHAGVKLIQIGCNDASAYCHLPPICWWEGPDGSRVLLQYTIDYGSGPLPPSNWPLKSYLAMIMRGDNEPPPSADEVRSVIAKIKERLPDAKVTVGSLDDFARAVEAEHPALPVVRGDMPDTWIHGLLTNPEEAGLARRIHPLESALDSLDTHLRVWGLDPPSVAGPLAEAYENSVLYGEHTFGSNMEAVGSHYGDDWKALLASGHYRNWLETYEVKRRYIRKTDAIVRRELKRRLDALAGNVKGGGVVVYNPLPWRRSGVVELSEMGKALFVADIPPSGYKSVRPPGPSTWTAVFTGSQGDRIETSFYRVVFDLKRGGIASLVEKRTGRELVDRSSPYALGQFLHERFSLREVQRFEHTYLRDFSWGMLEFGKPDMPTPDKSPYAAITPAGWRLIARRTQTADIASLYASDPAGLARSFEIRFTFPRRSNEIEESWKVDSKTPNPIPEGGWLCYPFKEENPVFTVGRPGGPINPATEIVPGANRHLLAVMSGVTVAGRDGSAVSLCPLDSPLVSLDEPGLWRFSLNFVPKRPAVFVNLYNNMWNTNYRLWQDGSWTSRVRFWPGRDLARRSWEARVPLLVGYGREGGRLPAQRTGLSVSRPGVLVTAYGGNPDGAGTLLRLWDQSGVTGPLTVTLPRVYASATPVTLRGEPDGRQIPLAGRRLSLSLHAYAPASFILK
jgi:hypothetical protein